MSTVKAGKLLAKALDNSSKDEATTAFTMAFSYAERAGIRLSSIHRVEVVETQSASITPERERELVDKYNRTLKRAKELAEKLEQAEQRAENYLDQAAAAVIEVNQLRAQRAADGVTDDMRSALALAQKFRAECSRLEGELTDALTQIATLKQALSDGGSSGDYRLRIDKSRAEERERITFAELIKTREAHESEKQKRREVEEENTALSSRVDELDKLYAERVLRCNNLNRDVQRLRDTVLQMEKDKRDLQRQLAAEKEARNRHMTTAEELAVALAECMRLRAIISEQAEENDALRSTRRALQIELDKYTDSPLKKLFGW